MTNNKMKSASVDIMKSITNFENWRFMGSENTLNKYTFNNYDLRNIILRNKLLNHIINHCKIKQETEYLTVFNQSLKT